MNIQNLRPLHHAAGRVPHAVLFMEDGHDDFTLMLCLVNTGHPGTVCSLHAVGQPEAYARLRHLQEGPGDEQP